VRAQYHSRKTPGGEYVWDVRRLVALAQALPVQRVPLHAIRELDEPYWEHEGGGPFTCRDVADHARLMEQCSLDFPVILSSDGRVMDGMHRVCKALLLGRDTIDAVQFAEDPHPDFIDVDLDSLPYEDIDAS
jgi:hypothetical protein